MPRTHTVDPQTAVGGAKFGAGETVGRVVRIRTSLFANQVRLIACSEFDSLAMDTATIPLAA